MTTLIGSPCCRTCSYSHVQDAETSCRRVPPTPHPVLGMVDTVQVDKQGQKQIVPMPQLLGKLAMFPKVEPDWCCGEYKKSILVPDND
jgi:hypothetical protein